MVGSLVIRLAAPLWWSINTPVEEMIRKGSPKKNPKRVPRNISRKRSKNNRRSNTKGVSIVTMSLGKIMAIRDMTRASFTGFGRIRAPKNGDNPTIGAILPAASRQSEKTETGDFHASVPFKKSCT
jgi:hypothetical protein